MNEFNLLVNEFNKETGKIIHLVQEKDKRYFGGIKFINNETKEKLSYLDVKFRYLQNKQPLVIEVKY